MNARGNIVNENHRRAVGAALAAFDEILCDIEARAEARERTGTLYIEENDIPPGRKEPLRKRVGDIRRALAEARDRLRLTPTRTRASNVMWSRCCAIRDVLSELSARHMKGYGDLSPGASRYLDDLSARLVEALDELSGEIRSWGRGAR
ncbi:MAG: hypothetical protein N3A38_02020 [Planctomycetota bacterium]|nr:hypothetical protein [Planctomycetota bacterium]